MTQNNDELDREMAKAIDEGDMERLDQLIAQVNKVEKHADEVINRKLPPTPKPAPAPKEATKPPFKSEHREGSAAHIFAKDFAENSPKEPETKETPSESVEELEEELASLVADLKYASEYMKNSPSYEPFVSLTKRQIALVGDKLKMARGETPVRGTGPERVFADYFREQERRKR